MTVIRLSFWIILCVLGGAGVAQAVEVPVRGGAHPSYGRVVFDWPTPVTFSATISDRQLAVRFNQPITARFNAALANLRGFVDGAQISADGRVVRLRLSGDFKLRSFKNDNAVVIDLLGTAESQAAAAPLLGVRVGEHPTYTRLVFDWNSAVTYTAGVEGASLSVRFDRPARIDLAALRRDLPSGVQNPTTALRDKGVALTLNVPAESRLRHFRSGTKVVVDIFAKPPAEQPQSASPPEAKQASTAPAIPKQAAAKPIAPVATAPEPAAPEAAAPEPKTAVPDDAPASPKKAADGPRRLLPKTASIASAVPGPKTAIATESKPSPARNDEPAAPPEKTPAVQTPEAEEGAAEAKRLVEEAFASARAEVSADGAAVASVSLVFEWPEAVGAAVFVRAGYTWVVFDRRAPLDLAPLRAAGRGLVSQIEQLPIGDASALRMVPNSNLSPFARRDGTNWIVEFREGRVRPEIQIPIEFKEGGDDGAELFFPAIEVGETFQVPDPEVGDIIKVATVQASSQGINGQRAYPEFQILASSQGIAVVPLNDDLELTKNDAGLTLALPGGLHVTGVSPDAGRDAGVKSAGQARRIFKLSEWLHGPLEDYYELRQQLQDDVAKQPKNRRNVARMKLAEFFFARGLAPEAKGVLQVIEGEDERLGIKPEFRAIKGAVAILNGEVNEAARNLNDPRLEKYEEIQLWRGAVAAAAENWPQAALYYQNGEAVLHGYPEPMKSRLALIGIDAALKARDPGAAGRWLNAISKTTGHLSRGQLATLHYLQGRVAFAKRDLNRAQELWTDLQDSGDTWNAARAALSLVNLGLLQETMPVDEAIKRLEALRYQWRGDEFELDVLRRLGGLYLDQQDYRNGLGTYRVIATYFPDHPDTPRIAQTMTDTFKKLYLEGEADNLPPLSALALYDEFRELTPAGPDGNIMIQKLAERLVDVDLLNRAADLLQHQVKFRLKGEERAVVGAKLALIRLLDRDPVAAIEALRTTAYSRLPEALDDDRRRIHARALFDTGKTQDAVELLAGDVSRNADLLRADIQWRSENWPEAAKALRRLAGEPPAEGTTFDRTEAQVVLNWAAALRLSQDESGLAVLRELYGPGMEASPLANAFRFIASPSGSDGPLDLVSVTSRLAETDVFDAFLAEYLEDNRRRLRTPEQ